MSLCPSEEVILAEERTTEEEKMHIMEARRRAAKKKKLKKIGKSKSTDTEEEQEEEDVADDGKITSLIRLLHTGKKYVVLFLLCDFLLLRTFYLQSPKISNAWFTNATR